MAAWTFGKRLAIGFGAVVVVTLALGAFGWWQLRAVGGDVRFITQSALPGVYNASRADALVRNNFANCLELVMTTDSARQQELQAKMDAGSATLTEVYKAYEASLTRDEDRKLLEAVTPLRAQYRKVREAALKTAHEGNQTEAARMLENSVRPALDQYVAALTALVDSSKRSADIAAPALERAVSRGTVGLFVGMGVAFLLGLAIAFAIVRSVNGLLSDAVRELRASSEQVASASSQIASSSQVLSSGASEQAASLEETSASMEEMSAMTTQSADNAERCAGLMIEAGQTVTKANAALADMTASMAGIGESSTKISKIIKTIDEIAFQTNLLALNAAVEAARAGEAGMGFAVVADEVRSLAQRSAQAARDTATLIEESIHRAGEGQSRVSVVTAAMEDVTRSSSGVKLLVDQMSGAARQQAQGISQVSTAISQMEKVTQSAAATAEESAATSEELSAQAENALAIVRRLAALAGAREEQAA